MGKAPAAGSFDFFFSTLSFALSLSLSLPPPVDPPLLFFHFPRFPSSPPPSLAPPPAASPFQPPEPCALRPKKLHRRGQRKEKKSKMDSLSEQQLPAPLSYPGAPRRRPSADARAAAWLSGVATLLSVLVMAVVGERERKREKERKWKSNDKERSRAFFLLPFFFFSLTLPRK